MWIFDSLALGFVAGVLCAEDMVGYILPRDTLGPHLEYLHPEGVRIPFHILNTEIYVHK